MPRAVTYSLMLSVVMTVIGIVLWIEGGPHPRTRAAWLLLAAIVIVSALPMLLCWRFC
jgi:heme/copper-type cytochrome/quinol oxidase subunit 4